MDTAYKTTLELDKIIARAVLHVLRLLHWYFVS